MAKKKSAEAPVPALGDGPDVIVAGPIDDVPIMGFDELEAIEEVADEIPTAGDAGEFDEVTIVVPLRRHKGGYCAGLNLRLSEAHRDTLRDIMDALVARGEEIATRPAIVKQEDDAPIVTKFDANGKPIIKANGEPLVEGGSLDENGKKVVRKKGHILQPAHVCKVDRHEHAIAWLLERIEAGRGAKK